VVHFGGELVEEPGFPDLAHDIALLSSLGIHLVLVHGIRPQVESRLTRLGEGARFHQGLRVTDDRALVAAKEAAGAVRVEVEALLSMGLANTPSAGARVRVASGNYITARPVGVRDGVDHQHTGEVRRVDVAGIQDQLSRGNVVLVSPIGYSPTGEAFNLSGEEVAGAVAVALGAAKLLFLGGEPVRDEAGLAVRQLSLEAAEALVAERAAGSEAHDHLRQAMRACRLGVERAHLVDGHRDGALLRELFTRDGVGTLVSADRYEDIRAARIDDVGGLLELIEPLERQGTLVRRPREKLEQEIERFTVLERDGTIIACSALYPSASTRAWELACLAVHPDYRSTGLGEAMLGRVERAAREAGGQQLYVLTTHTAHWFRERGFLPGRVEDLPLERRTSYNYQRNSRVLVKDLTP
jgi:amino-acid N-acetyltransferase